MKGTLKGTLGGALQREPLRGQVACDRQGLEAAVFEDLSRIARIALNLGPSKGGPLGLKAFRVQGSGSLNPQTLSRTPVTAEGGATLIPKP